MTASSAPGGRWPAGLAVLVVMLWVGPLSAQVRTSLDAGAGTGLLGPGVTGDALILQPHLEFHAIGADMTLEGRIAGFVEGSFSSGLGVRSTWDHRILEGLQARLDLNGDWDWYAEAGGSGEILAELGARVGSDASRAWLSGGLGRAGDGTGWSGIWIAEAGGQLSFADFRLRLSTRTTALGDIAQKPDTTPGTGEGITGLPGLEPQWGSRSYTDGEVGLGWASGRVDLELVGGLRLDDRVTEDESWVRATATVALSPQVSAVLSGGRLPGQPQRGLESRDYYLVGMRLAIPTNEPREETGRTPTLTVRPVPDGRRLLRLEVPNADHVEIMGDFTDWLPVAMTPVERHGWEVRLRIEPGLHRLNIRVDDGEWSVPPGLNVVDDGFSGEVAILWVP